MHEPLARAVDFETREVYRSSQRPSYTSWVSFFRGEQGQWYLTCEEVTRPQPPLPQCTREQWFAMGLPNGYDKSQYLMELVILESKDQMESWNVISRQSARFQHSPGTYANQMRTRDGRFLRFVWAGYSLDPAVQPGDIFYVSDDNGQTWDLQPSFVDPEHFSHHANRLRMLRDGTLVLCICHCPRFGPGTELPSRNCKRLDVMNERQMMVFISHDQGRTWSSPMGIYCGQDVSETDFVELPDGHLLFINNSIFAHPGRQIVYRHGDRFTPGPFEKVKHLGPEALVPETVCLTDEGMLIGCMRCSEYMWSDDLGESWWRVADIPVLEGGSANPRRQECYQPSMEYLGEGRVACAGHYGGDDPVGSRDQYLSLHTFRLELLSKPRKAPRLEVERDFDESRNRWVNSYTLSLTCEGVPLADQELELWYAKRYEPGYDSFGKLPLEERMQIGGTLLRASTDAEGKARFALAELDEISDVHLSYQFVVRFNTDRSDPDYRPAQSPEFCQYALSSPDPPLEPGG